LYDLFEATINEIPQIQEKNKHNQLIWAKIEENDSDL
jgi:hypothetical protein